MNKLIKETKQKVKNDIRFISKLSEPEVFYWHLLLEEEFKKRRLGV